MQHWMIGVRVAVVALLLMGIALTASPLVNAAPSNTFTCTTVTEIPQAECVALVALYNSTNGAGWINKTNWLNINKPCSWYGVTCEGGSVTKLSLHNNQLSGNIPPELGNLINLLGLFLHNNQLSGNIPPTLGNLVNLQWLSLHTTQLSGALPPALGNLTTLVGLWLYDNQLSGSIPAELGNLINLLGLFLHNNQLNGPIPPELGNLANLYQLDLGNNQLSGVMPPELGNLTKLEWLLLANNQLSGTIPAALGNLANVYRLSLHTNQLSGAIPAELGNLANLQELLLSDNQLSGAIPAALGNLANLYQLSLYNNQLSGALPPALGNLTTLQGLWLYNNQLSGNIPPALGNLVNLLGLSLHTNQLSGAIPPALGNLTTLLELWLDNNQLSDGIPAALGNLTNLRWLSLHNNQLRGAIPATLCTLPLISADFGYNQLAAADPCLAAKDPDWAQTQTVPPTNVQAQALANQQVQLTWTPITYAADGGYYTVLAGVTAGGPYPVAVQTTDKTASAITLPALGPGRHHLIVRTFTPKHGEQQNDLTSDNSQEVVVIFNTPPLAASAQVTVTQGRALSIVLTASDVDSDPLQYSLVSLPGHGLLSGTAPTLTYTAVAEFTGTDSFTFKANDGQADSNLATITIQVVAAPLINTAPVANGQTVTTTQGSRLALTLSATDGEGNDLTYRVIDPPGHGTLSGALPLLTYMPAAGFSGADRFTFQVNDGQHDSVPATVSITVQPLTKPGQPTPALFLPLVSR